MKRAILGVLLVAGALAALVWLQWPADTQLTQSRSMGNTTRNTAFTRHDATIHRDGVRVGQLVLPPAFEDTAGVTSDLRARMVDDLNLAYSDLVSAQFVSANQDRQVIVNGTPYDTVGFLAIDSRELHAPAVVSENSLTCLRINKTLHLAVLATLQRSYVAELADRVANTSIYDRLNGFLRSVESYPASAVNGERSVGAMFHLPESETNNPAVGKRLQHQLIALSGYQLRIPSVLACQSDLRSTYEKTCDVEVRSPENVRVGQLSVGYRDGRWAFIVPM